LAKESPPELYLLVVVEWNLEHQFRPEAKWKREEQLKPEAEFLWEEDWNEVLAFLEALHFVAGVV
jgi:hypothetical protein